MKAGAEYVQETGKKGITNSNLSNLVESKRGDVELKKQNPQYMSLIIHII